MKATEKRNSSYGKMLGLMLAITALFSTGCMITPGDGEEFASRSSTIDVFGMGMSPNETVEIQARIPGTGVWETVGMATTSGTATPYFGIDFYMYAVDVTIRNQLWQFSWSRVNPRYKTEVRVLDSSGASLLTFEDGFDTYLWDYDVTDSSDLSDLYLEHGTGTSVIIYADQ